mgnify:FL=1|jgi:polar amino acid transport system permease protein
MNYDFDLFFLQGSFPKLMEGLLLTLKLTVASNLIGLSLGFVLALMAMSKNPFIRWPTTLFIDFFRCTPALIQVIWFFYCIPIVFDVYMDGLSLGILAIGFNLASFNAESYRASIQSIPREQNDASIALGLSPLQRSIWVILPQAFRASLPVLVANGIGAFQQTALVAVVALQDLMYMGKMIATDTYRPIETFTLVALIYLAISLPVSQLVEYLDRRRKAAM